MIFLPFRMKYDTAMADLAMAVFLFHEKKSLNRLLPTKGLPVYLPAPILFSKGRRSLCFA